MFSFAVVQIFKCKNLFVDWKDVSVGELATKPEDPSSIPKTHMVEGKNKLP